MKNNLLKVLLVLLAVCTVSAAFAAVGTGWDDDCRGNPNADGTFGKHNWVKTGEIHGNTCAAPSTISYACSYCGAQITRLGPSRGHRWGSWSVVSQATCQHTGTQRRTCTICGETETKTIAKTDHQYGAWITTAEATCRETGQQVRICSACGHTETKTIARTSHHYGSWKVVREPTCQKAGLQRRTCKVCGEKQEKSIKKTAHEYGNWVVTVECTDHSAGERTGTCIWCGKRKTESFDPEGTLRRGDKGDAVREMQLLLADDGYMKAGNAKGSFNQATEKAVSAFQKAHGLKADGVAWPQTLKLLHHDWNDWEIVTDTTPFSAGVRRRTCRTCDKVQEEAFDPPGTLRRNDKGEAVRELQIRMKEIGIFRYNTTGEFGKNTEASVKQFQKKHGLTVDGIAWPGVIDMIFGKDPEKTPGDGADLPASAEPDEPPELVLIIHDIEDEKAVAGLDVGFFVTVTNTGKSDTDLVAVSKGAQDTVFTEAWMDDGLKAGNSYEMQYSARIQEDEAEAGWLQREVSVTVRDPKTNLTATASAAVLITLTKDGLQLTVQAEDTAGWVMAEGEEREVKCQVINSGSEPILSLALSYSDAKDKIPADDSITGLPEVLPSPFLPGAVLEFTYHCRALPEDTAEGMLLRRIRAEGISAAGDTVSAFDEAIITLAKEIEVPSAVPTVLKLEKSILGEPDNHAWYVPGEKIHYQLTLTNTSKVQTVKKVRVEDPRIGFEGVCDQLLPGESVNVNVDYEVTLPDALAGKIVNVAQASWTDEDGNKRTAVSEKKQALTGLTPGMDYLTVELKKTVISKPENKLFYQAGEDVLFEITATNLSSVPISYAEVFDTLETKHFGKIGEISDLAPGDSISLYFTYKVDKSDLGAGEISNTAYATCFAPGYLPTTVYSNTVTVPVGVFTIEMIDGPCIVKAEISTPKNGSYYVEGETIDYAITVVNPGSVGMSGIISDILEPSPGEITGMITLGKDEFITVPYSYKVTAIDAAKGSVVNIASFDGYKRDQNMINLVSNAVVSPTGIPKAKPKGGTVCVRSVLQHSSSSENCSLEYCTEHAAVAERAEKLTAGAKTESEQLSAWQEASEIWTDALNREYRQRIAYAGAAQREVIQREWTQFYVQLTSYRSMLISRAGAETAEIAELTARMLMNHCADLCSEASLRAQDRRDSVLKAKKLTGIALTPNRCLIQELTTEEGTQTSTVLCGEHQKTERLIDSMLEGVNTSNKAQLTAVWTQGQEYWTAALDRAANEWYSALGDSGQLALVWRITYGEWLKAREDMLESVYPDSPECVQEIVMRIIRESVMDLCSRD